MTQNGKQTITNTVVVNANSRTESQVKEKAENELKSISFTMRERESTEIFKTTKEIFEAILSDTPTIITVMVSPSVASAGKNMTSYFPVHKTAGKHDKDKLKEWENHNVQMTRAYSPVVVINVHYKD